jgi:flagellin
MKINHNLPAMNTQYNQYSNNKLNAKAAEKISSGRGINKAADNAAGLAIVAAMANQIGGLTQATQNSQDAVSLVQTADGALNESQSMLNRINVLSVQAANSTYTDSQRGMIQDEITQLQGGLNDIANTTSFNNQNLLNGSATNMTFQTGANELNNMTASIGNMNSVTLGVSTIDVTNAASAGKAITSAQQASSVVSSQRSSLGAYQNRLQDNINGLGNAVENQTASLSGIQDADTAAAIMDYTKSNILQQTNNAMMAQANKQPSQVLRLLG